jgi:hypothetical protein
MRVLTEYRQSMALARARKPTAKTARHGKPRVRRPRKYIALDFYATEEAIVMIVPLHTVCEANEKVGTRRQSIGRSKRRAKQRLAMGAWLRQAAAVDGVRMRDCRKIHMVRFSPGTCDLGGNLESCFKSIRDEIASYLGFDDSPSSPLSWTCGQVKGPAYGVRIELRC